MPIIEVKQSFKVRLADGEPIREFPAGRHEISADELGNWFIRDGIRTGSIIMTDKTAESAAGDGNEDAPEQTPHPVQLSELEAAESERDELKADLEAARAEAAELKTVLKDKEAARNLAATRLDNEVAAHKGTMARLEAARVKIRELEETTMMQPPSDADSAGESLESRMLAVFPRLTGDDFKADGTPRVKAVVDLLEGETVTADQVALAWDVHLAGRE